MLAVFWGDLPYNTIHGWSRQWKTSKEIFMLIIRIWWAHKSWAISRKVDSLPARFRPPGGPKSEWHPKTSKKRYGNGSSDLWIYLFLKGITIHSPAILLGTNRVLTGSTRFWLIAISPTRSMLVNSTFLMGSSPNWNIETWIREDQRWFRSREAWNTQNGPPQKKTVWEHLTSSLHMLDPWEYLTCLGIYIYT